MEQTFDEDSQGVSLIKIEPNFEEDSLEAQMTNHDSCEISDVKIQNGVTKNSMDLKYDNRKTKGKVEPYQTSTTQKKTMEFEKLFSENKHRFDMTCDACPKMFDSLDEARSHYASDHNNPRGYIKCCNVKLIYRCKVVKHLYRHLDPDKFKCLWIFRCHECGKVYIAFHVLKAHMKQHDANNPNGEREMVICDICKKAFTSKIYLKKHLEWHTTGQQTDDEHYRTFIADNFDMNCDQCDVVFTTFHDARRHYRDLHNVKKGYIKCCSMKLNEFWLVIDHINSQHLNPKVFKCELCDKMYADRKRFYLHKRRHKQATMMPFICDYCGKHFANKETITRHLFNTHVKSKPKFECETCHKRFQLMSLLRNHYYSVHREKKANVTCEICGKSFEIKANFDKHMLLHTDKSERLAQRKQCSHCGEWLMTKSGIYYHDIIHNSGVQKCNQCPTELPHKLALMAHIRKYHREPKHRCNHCGKTFEIGSKLREHEDSHTRQNIYPCFVANCSKTFTVLSSRQTHMRRNHPEEQKERNKMRKMLQLTPS
ncbi:zinc finger protein 665-like isoform X2 [Sitodiplosis mosellana]|uniref:zinc finger protein 665-like isoform X2 n=1 Tax=Sitodiplosis mosellana TaxID=263140 RepID=UPI0024452786|nr:zinc finger protein 665-like isoform X2 [Sitodiplosis mosellana]